MQKFVTENDAIKLGLIQLYYPEMYTEAYTKYLVSEMNRITQDKSRTAVIVKKGIYLALWVDNAAERLSKEKFGGGNDF